ncbi:hypothetical protein ABDJ41_13940 [Pedobacter sp. ASV1-7]|uniref:hypothetical protein n=1 Tax=Pedobacter sp. ASV1-7 TaxID=3145237 RepID=UPI0032E85799
MLLFFLVQRRFYLRTIAWDFIAFGFILLWAYGLILGFLSGNKLSYIVANNAGMVLYFVYYLLLQFRIPKEKIYKLAIYAGVSIGCITVLLFIFSFTNIPANFLFFLGEFTGGSSTGQRRIYFVSQISLFPALALYMSAFIASRYQKLEYFDVRNLKQNIRVFFAFMFFTMCVMFFTASKGFMLGYLFILFTLPFALFFRGFYHGYINKKIIFFLVLLVILVVLLLSFGYFNIITATFDNKDEANIRRYEQLFYLLQDLTIWGKGLGAVIPGYSRNLDKPYGFELSYLSLIHKFGIFGIVAVLLYLVIIFKAIANVIIGYNVRYAITAIGCMCYLLPSIGNPLLFAPQAVVLNCLALYLLRKEKS